MTPHREPPHREDPQPTPPADAADSGASTTAPDARTSGLSVARWTRYGKDHLYVTHPNGTRLGYWDLETEESQPTAPEYDELVRHAVAGWTSPQETSPQRWPRVVNLFGGVSGTAPRDRV